jgi:hypothetical protein
MKNLFSKQNIMKAVEPWLKDCKIVVNRKHFNAVKYQELIETNCEFTAGAIRWLVNGDNKNKWLVSDDSFDNVFQKYPIFQVTIGENNKPIHVLTVAHEKKIQSYHGNYSCKCEQLDEEDKNILRKKVGITLKEFCFLSSIGGEYCWMYGLDEFSFHVQFFVPI